MRKTKNKSFFYLLGCSILLLSAGCEKNSSKVSNPGITNLSEQKLLGKWLLKRSETYEITGTDSSGNYQCNLIGSSTCDSLCAAEFKQKSIGIGSIGGCDPNASFTWRVKQQNKMEIGTGNFYDIIYLSSDSVAFSNVYVKDILTLKSALYYKRK